MPPNFFKVAWRNMLRHKAYASITIFGLAVGLCCVVLILLFVRDELLYDRHHEHHERIVRLSREWFNDDGNSTLHLGHVASGYLPRIAAALPDYVEHAVRLSASYPLVSYGEHHFTETRLFYADSTFFKVFTQRHISGDPDRALSTLNTAVIAQSIASKYFGDENPLGKELLLNNSTPIIVGAVVEDMPLNSHFHPEILISFLTLEQQQGREFIADNLNRNGFSSFVLLKDGVTPKEFEEKLVGFVDDLLSPFQSAESVALGLKPSMFTKLHVWRITDIHLHSNLASEIEANGDIRYVTIFGIVAIFLLLIACINFTNLSTARSSTRMKEVGLRKVVGASRGILMRQFLGESMFITLIALLLSLVLVLATLPWFNHLMQKQLELNFFTDVHLWLILAFVALFTGFVAGGYPALFLSRFEPAHVLKSQTKLGSYRSRLRFALVTFQFTISAVLIICMGVVKDQMVYVQNRSLGFDREGLIVFGGSNTIRPDWNNYKNRLLQHPGIEEVTVASRIPSGRLLDSFGGTAEVDGEMKPIETRVADVHVDHDFFDTFRISLAGGRFFDPLLASDSTQAFMLNEAAVRAIGWKSVDEALGKKIKYGNKDGYLIGVVNDFHFESLHQTIAPVIFSVNYNRFFSIVVRYQGASRDQVLETLGQVWEEYNPNVPFSPSFISDRYIEQYDAEQRLANIFVGFSSLAVFIACLGLFGLASFMTERRTREIGVRKVLGARVSDLVRLLGWEFLKPVVAAFILAVPIAWYAMHRWLETFAYHTHIGATPFVFALLVAIAVAGFSVSLKTFQAAQWNPVNLLKNE